MIDFNFCSKNLFRFINLDGDWSVGQSPNGSRLVSVMLMVKFKSTPYTRTIESSKKNSGNNCEVMWKAIRVDVAQIRTMSIILRGICLNETLVQ
ncbi:hypothetical protein TNCT_456891 [Trichonephila clavata]|uniref:Uncharacterized protein n=1 Tax=Trichonephila clavata TaxID=2740835 RepID=A0A8X6F195_TRICU|nr:hypothetical protein TNCT_456891 [Trichonephila clavata]